MQENSPTIRKITLAMMAVSFFGFMDTMYLTSHKLLGIALKCGLSTGCDEVAASPYSSVLGVPLSLFGVIFYLLIFFSLFIGQEFGIQKLLRFGASLTAIGFLISAYLFYLQLFVINAICPYCMASGAGSVILLILGVILIRGTSGSSPSLNASAQE